MEMLFNFGVLIEKKENSVWKILYILQSSRVDEPLIHQQHLIDIQALEVDTSKMLS